MSIRKWVENENAVYAHWNSPRRWSWVVLLPKPEYHFPFGAMRVMMNRSQNCCKNECKSPDSHLRNASSLSLGLQECKAWNYKGELVVGGKRAAYSLGGQVLRTASSLVGPESMPLTPGGLAPMSAAPFFPRAPLGGKQSTTAEYIWLCHNPVSYDLMWMEITVCFSWADQRFGGTPE